MRRSVRGIWIGLLVLALGSATLRFILYALEHRVPSVPGLLFNFAIVVCLTVAVWLIALRIAEARQRRLVVKLEERFPGAVTFPSLPTPDLAAGVRLVDPDADVENADALTVQLDAGGLSVRYRGRDSIELLLHVDRDRVLDVGGRVVPTRFGPHPSIAVVLKSGDGLIPLVFPAFQPARPFRRASSEQVEALAAEARDSLA